MIDLDGRKDGMPVLAADIGYVAASQIVVEASPLVVSTRRSTAMILLAHRASAVIAGADHRIVEGWRTFTAAEWHSFSADDWRDFGATENVGQRSGRIGASQVLAVLDDEATAPTGRSAASQIITASNTNRAARSHVRASMLLTI